MLKFTALLLLLHAAGISIFMSGFLLTRTALPNVATCPQNHWNSTTAPNPLNVTAGCYPSRRFKRAVVVVIDALRYDMAEYNPSLSANQTPHFANKLPSIHRLLNEAPERSRLYRFIADAPTTTMQRIKGITTGGLPTFVDSSDNFASQAIEEDNILKQMVHAGRNITMMGDDTWVGLFPGAFQRAFPFPSFNVRDLDSVDLGVRDKLKSELSRPDWDLLIAHYLGVDHCGHRYGPNHPAMAVKLTEMDAAIENITKWLPEDTVLLVFGDHGMTAGGDHGGDSPNELHSALFIHSGKAPFLRRSTTTTETPTSVAQLDLAPTLAFLLGLPVPFGSIGQAISELVAFGDGTDDFVQFAAVARANALQVRTYLTRYSKSNSDLSPLVVAELDKVFAHADALLLNDTKHTNSSEKYDAARAAYRHYIELAKAQCRDIWSTFDVGRIGVGLVVMFGTVLVIGLELFVIHRNTLNFQIGAKMHEESGETNAGLSDNSDPTSTSEKKTSQTLKEKTAKPLYSTIEKEIMIVRPSRGPPTSFILMGAISGGIVGGVAQFAGVLPWGICAVLPPTAVCAIGWHIISSVQHDRYAAASACLKFYVFGLKMKSDIVIVATVCLVMNAVCSFSNSFVVHHDSITAFLATSLLLFLCAREAMDGSRVSAGLWLVCAVLSRITSLYGVCREEQEGCAKYEPPASFAFASLCLFAGINVMWLRDEGLLNLSSVWRRAALLSSLLLVIGGHRCVDFALEAEYSAAGGSKLPPALRNVPGIRECVEFFGSQQGQRTPALVAYAIALLYMVMLFLEPLSTGVHKYESDTKGDKPTAVLYGFHTALSAPFLALTSGLMALTFLLLDWTASPALFLIWLQTLFLLDAKRSSAMWPHFEYAAVVAWYLIAESAFYVTSHQPEFPSVQWASGLVGVSEGMHLMSGCLIGINTWGTFLTLAVALPLLVAWSPASSWVSSTPSPRELWLLRDPNGRVELRLGLQRITLLFQLLFALSTLLSCTAAGLHRRHLMVWKIFAPRVIFDCVKLLVTSAGTWVGWLFVARLSARLEATEHDFVPMAAASTD